MKRLITLSCYLFLSFFHPPYSTLHAYDLDPRGFWYGEDVESLHVFDSPLALGLINFFQAEKASSVVDFGCGMGDYQLAFLEDNIYTEAYDGNPATLFLTGGRAGIQDLSIPFDLGKRFDWVLSLEVGDNIPKQFERTFIENLIRHANKGIVLSWAVPGQGGFGHCNEQSNQVIQDLMASYGWFNDDLSAQRLRSQAHYSWFNKTIMVFRNLVDPLLMDRLHKEN